MIFIGLGSNLGDRALNLRDALRRMPAAGVHPLRASSLYETEPWGMLEQGPFLNAVCEVRSSLEPEALLEALLGIEAEMGRERLERWGPRLIDLDLLEYHGQQRAGGILELPHPRYSIRSFVLAPLLELEPGWIPTGSSAPASALLAQLAEPPPRRLPSVSWASPHLAHL
ncbi:MAG: 2-amino-4-hydroxy-6-hydroxymethyldihydropteridine diphosphokinase [Bacteroidia bacterium]|nr:2-amino-4-hydroxy-6-hydroxymethyldihydropteridine diphosphokinase [Bacteroidia bacterium]